MKKIFFLLALFSMPAFAQNKLLTLEPGTTHCYTVSGSYVIQATWTDNAGCIKAPIKSGGSVLQGWSCSPTPVALSHHHCNSTCCCTDLWQPTHNITVDSTCTNVISSPWYNAGDCTP